MSMHTPNSKHGYFMQRLVRALSFLLAIVALILLTGIYTPPWMRPHWLQSSLEHEQIPLMAGLGISEIRASRFPFGRMYLLVTHGPPYKRSIHSSGGKLLCSDWELEGVTDQKCREQLETLESAPVIWRSTFPF